LARIKARSLGADTLVLSALAVLAYAQMEGGVKDLSACVIKHVNRRKLACGEVAPRLLDWRNQDHLTRFRSAINYDMIGAKSPFSEMLKERVQIRPINRAREFNQMSWAALKRIYEGFGLDGTTIARSAADIDSLVGFRNDAAHHGSMPTTTAAILENQVRRSVLIVEDVLTDFTLQLLTFFEKQMHKR